MHGDAEEVPQAGEDGLHRLRLPAGSKLGGDERAADVWEDKPLWLEGWWWVGGGPAPPAEPLTSLSRDLQRLAVAEGAPPPPGREHLVFQTAEDDAELHLRGDGRMQDAGGGKGGGPRTTCTLTCLLTEKPMETATKGNLGTEAARERGSLIQLPWKPCCCSHPPMNKVGGSINGINDPGGLIRQDTRLTCSHRLLPYEPATPTHTHTHVCEGKSGTETA